MMEKNTDRLFWTLTSIIVGALLLTISAKAFPQVTSSIVKPISGVITQEDKNGHAANNAANEAFNKKYTISDSNNNSSNSNVPTPSQANIQVQNNGDGTAVFTGMADTSQTTLTIPPYVNVNGKILTITSVADGAVSQSHITSLTLPNTLKTIGASSFSRQNLTSLSIPNGVTSIGGLAFSGNQLTSVTIPDSVTNIGYYAFLQNNLTNVSVKSGTTIQMMAFDGNVNITQR